MPLSRVFPISALALALAAGPALTTNASAQSSKSRAAKSAARAKSKTAPTAAETATPEAAPSPATQAPATPEQKIATSNPAETIPAVLQASGQFTVLLKAVQATNLSSVLGGPRPLTVFAPTDQAFAAVPPGVLDALMLPANADTLQKILTYHVIAAKVPAVQIRGKAASPVLTANGASVTVSGVGGAIKVGDATVIQSDVQASNGVIHVIDRVLLPPGVRLPAPATAASRAASTATTTTPSMTAPAGATPARPATPATPALRPTSPAQGAAPVAPS